MPPPPPRPSPARGWSRPRPFIGAEGGGGPPPRRPLTSAPSWRPPPHTPTPCLTLHGWATTRPSRPPRATRRCGCIRSTRGGGGWRLPPSSAATSAASRRWRRCRGGGESPGVGRARWRRPRLGYPVPARACVGHSGGPPAGGSGCGGGARGVVVARESARESVGRHWQWQRRSDAATTGEHTRRPPWDRSVDSGGPSGPPPREKATPPLNRRLPVGGCSGCGGGCGGHGCGSSAGAARAAVVGGRGRRGGQALGLASAATARGGGRSSWRGRGRCWWRWWRRRRCWWRRRGPVAWRHGEHGRLPPCRWCVRHPLPRHLDAVPFTAAPPATAIWYCRNGRCGRLSSGVVHRLAHLYLPAGGGGCRGRRWRQGRWDCDAHGGCWSPPTISGAGWPLRDQLLR